MYPGYNPRLSSVDGLAGYWVVVLPEEPRIGRLVFEDGQWFLVLGSGERVPVRLEAPPRAETHRGLGMGLRIGSGSRRSRSRRRVRTGMCLPSRR